MAAIYNPRAVPTPATQGFCETLGNTPLIEIRSLTEYCGGCRILAKAEFLSPGGSVKDRTAANIILEAENEGLLKPGGLVVEGTGGNTGIALALICRSKGYRLIITMNRTISQNKQNLLRLFGAELVLTEPCGFAEPTHFCHVARRIAEEKGGFYVNQFENLGNFRAHYGSTGPEIWKQTDGKISAFCAASGTGGTLAGVSAYLKEQDSSIQCYLIDCPTSHLYHYVTDGELKVFEGELKGVEGIGSDRLTANFKLCKLDGALVVTSEEAIRMSHHLLQTEGLFVGSSAALNLVGAVRVARRLQRQGQDPSAVVTILCDGGDRYMTKGYSEAWLRENGFGEDVVRMGEGSVGGWAFLEEKDLE